MNIERKWIGVSLLVVALIAAGIVSAFTLADGTNEKPRKNRAGCLDQLTEEQREALDQMTQELKDAGATPEEIREAVQQYLEELGIDIEDCLRTMEEFGPRGPKGAFNELTEEQREALDQMTQELKDAGATPEEIQEAVQQYLEEQGIDIESWGPMEGFGPRGPMGCFKQLTEEQREALDQMTQELKDAGATPEEIQEAVQQYLEEQGIDIGLWGPMEGFGPRGFHGCYDQLTEEQREALNQLIQELKDAGATPEEIQEAVQQYLEELGIDTEQCGGMGEPGHRTQSEGGP